MEIHRTEFNFRLHAIVLGVQLAMAGSVMAGSPAPTALPTGGQLVSGQATITQPSAAQMQIHQTTQQATLNWQTFNIGSAAQVNFQQPNGSSVALNRVLQSDASVIEGRLTANGQVFLVNPGGVVFGKTAQVDVGGLVATTMNISDKDFAAGNYHFTRDGSGGAVINQGQITAAGGGYVALVAATVVNSGSITANRGTVALAAGDGATLQFNGASLVNVQVDPATVKALIENKQLIQAQDGQVLMTAVAASKLQSAVINNAGAVEANSLSSSGGVIRLTGADEIDNSGTLDASGKTSGGTVTLAAGTTVGADSSAQTTPLVHQGGTIHADSTTGVGGQVVLAGEYLQLDTGSLTSATGAAGGGQIYAGGGLHGSPLPSQTDSVLPNATYTRVERGAVLDASATGSGNGGTIIATSSNQTYFGGTAKAEGGPNGGDGGSIENSGSQLNIDSSAKVSTLAPMGKAGTWLLDPNDFTIAASGGNITGASLSSELQSNNVITINTSVQGTPGNGDIFVNDAVTWSNNSTLNLQAQRNININSSINPSGDTAGLALTAGGDINVNSTVTNGISSNYAGIYATGNSPTVSLTATGNINVTAIINATGNTTVNPVPNYAGINATGSNPSLSLTAATGKIDITGTIIATGYSTTITTPINYAGINATGNNASLSLVATVNNINDTSNISVNGKTYGANPPVNYAGINATGDSASLTLEYGSTSGNGYFLNNGAEIALSGSSPTLNIGVAGGTAEKYTVINSLAGLQAINNNTNNLKLNYALGSDIDASSAVNFSPIGNPNPSDATTSTPSTAIPFSGYFDGLGHIIRNLTINFPAGTDVGLFGQLNSPNVSHIGLINASVTGNYNVGILAGQVIGGSVTYAFSDGKVCANASCGATDPEGIADYAGGLIGENYSVLQNSFSTARIIGTGDVGGLAGYNSITGIISMAYSQGAVFGNYDVGGLVGYSSKDITSSYSTGSVTGIGSNSFYIGGLVGLATDSANIVSSYSMGAVSGNAQVGGLVGFLQWGTIHGSYSTGLVSGIQNTGDSPARDVGGLVGQTSDPSSGFPTHIYNSFWDMTTSGKTIGVGSIIGGPGPATGLTTAQMMNSTYFTSGTDATNFPVWSRDVWGFGAVNAQSDYYPYLLWRFPTLPQVVSGILSGTDNTGQTIAAVQQGRSLSQFPATYTDQSQASTGANGMYYFVLNSPISSYSGGGVSAGNGLLVYSTGTPNPSTNPPITPTTGSMRLSDGNNLLLLDLTPYQLTVSSQLNDSPNYTGYGITSSEIAKAVGTLTATSSPGIPYTYSAGVFNLGSGISFVVTDPGANNGISYFHLGDTSTTLTTIQTNNASQNFNNTAINLDGNAELYTVGTGSISIGGSVSGDSSSTTTYSPTHSAFSLSLNTNSNFTATGKFDIADLGLFEAGSNSIAYTLNNSNNVIDTLAANLANTGSISLLDNAPLSIGTVNGTAGITTHGTVNLVTTTGGISQTATGLITAGSLTGSAAGTAHLDNAGNSIAQLGPFTAAGAFSLADAAALDVTGTVSGAGVSITTNTAGNGITLDGAVQGGAGNVALNSAGIITQNAGGAISTTGSLTGSAAGTAHLDNAANSIAQLGPFTASGAFSLADAAALDVTGTVSGAGISLSTTGAGKGITLDNQLQGGAGNVALNSAGIITQNAGGAISTTGSLTGGATGTAHLDNAANSITQLGPFSATGAFSLTDAAALDVTGTVSGAGISLSTTGAGKGITLDNQLQGGAGNVVLNSAGGATENAGGKIGGAGLLLQGTGPFTLKQTSNDVTMLAANTSGGSINYSNDSFLTVGSLGLTNGITSGNQAVNLDVRGNLTIAYNVNTGFGSVNLTTSVGDINGAGGTIITTNTAQGGGLTLTAAGGIGVNGVVLTNTSGNGNLTPLSLTTYGTGALGNISLIEENTLETSRVDITQGLSVGTGRTVSLTSLASDTIYINASIGNFADSLTLAAPSGSIFNSGSGGLVTAGGHTGLTLDAGVAIGSSVNPITTAASVINTTSSDTTLGGKPGVGGIYLSNNQSTTLTALATAISGSSGAIDVANTSGMLTVAAVTSNFNTVYLRNPSNATTDGITLAAGSTVTGSDPAGITAVALSANQRFINDAGTSAISISNGGGRWLVYSNNPTNDIFGPANNNVLASNNIAGWNVAYANYPSSTLTGNRYLFAYQPTVTFTGDTLSKTYGTAIDVSTHWTASGFYTGNGQNNGAFTQDSLIAFNGTPLVTSTGSVATAHVVNPDSTDPNSPNYTIAVAQGGMTSSNGNAMAFVNSILTIDPVALTVTANNAGKTYGQTISFTGTEFGSSGLQNGETIGSVNLGSLGSVASAHVAGSPYVISASNASGGTFTPSDYTIRYVNGALSINPAAAITVTADSANKTYGQTVSFAGTEFTAAGLQNGETVGSVTLTSTGVPATAAVTASPYVITASNAVGGSFSASDYERINYANGALTVNPLPVVITGTRVYDSTTGLDGTLFSATNLVGNDALNFAGSATAGSANVGTYTINGPAPNGLNIAGLTLGGSSAGNYTLAGASGNGGISYRTITLTAGSNAPGTRTYGDATNPVPTVPAEYIVGGLGMAGTENAKTLFGFSVGSTADSTTAAGVYLPGTAQAYKVGGVGVGTNGNYNIKSINDGTLTISPLAQPVAMAIQPPEIEPKPAPNYLVNSAGNNYLVDFIGELEGARGSGSGDAPAANIVTVFWNGMQQNDKHPVFHHSAHSRLIGNSRNPLRAMRYAQEYGLKPFPLQMMPVLEHTVPVAIKPYKPFVEPNPINSGDADAGLELPKEVPTWGVLQTRLIKPSN